MDGKYFQQDEASRWQLSPMNQCFICDHHKYVTVFYERGIMSGNKEFIEIRDKNILETLKAIYDKDGDTQAQTPLIFGTLVNRCKHEGLFQRK